MPPGSWPYTGQSVWARSAVTVTDASTTVRMRFMNSPTIDVAGRLKTAPNLGQFQTESFDDPLTRNVLAIRQHFGFRSGPVDVNRAMVGVKQPAEACPVLDPFAHLRFHLGKAIRRGHQLHDKVRTQRE